jgi:hypothetical protein
MILDYSLGALFASPGAVVTGDLAAYSCRGVSIPQLYLILEKSSGAKQPTNFRAGLKFNNNSGKDKKVTATVDLRSNDTSLGIGAFRHGSVEQGDTGWRWVSFPITLRSPGTEPPPYLRLTIEILDY